MNRKHLLLAVLAGILILSLGYAYWAMPRQEKAPPRAKVPRSTAKAIAAGKKAPPPADRLQLGLLAQAPQPFPGTRRDIFRFLGGGAPLFEAPAAVAPPVEVAPPPPPPTPEQLLRQQVTAFTFLGFLERGGVKTVFLSSEGELFLVKAGERFGKGQELLAQEITKTELVVGTAAGLETVRVQLIENEALMPALLAPGTGSMPSTGLRTGGTNLPPRRSVLRQRAVTRPMTSAADDESEEAVEQDVQPPDEGVKQEELLKQGLPGGEGDGKTQ